MPKRMVNETVVLVREVDGKVTRITPKIGKGFDFTADEIADIEGSSDTAISKFDKDADETASADDATSEVIEPKKPAAAKGAAKDTGDL